MGTYPMPQNTGIPIIKKKYRYLKIAQNALVLHKMH
jgi:hypothetical protein